MRGDLSDYSDTLIVAGSLLRIAQYLPGFHDFGELFFARMAVRIFVRMVLHDEFFVLILQLCV